ncbi:hypothetical protein SNE35_11435 [Paucibacter sp. R3-3]|uniref:Uncharacterized protein n=1 Tax=Roseateles agri TaxID=3098619 RepID=A0ABU5DFR7_9BURK|nr:hypothetical protein [Paucibacter sp. R3-3]MDY0745127.1 hypothetical protein [Paucibacter sp. R3-3]
MNATVAKTPAATKRKAPAKSATPVKAAAKTATKPAAKPTAKPAAPAAEAKPAKVKLVRDSFTMPSDEYAALGQLKQRALAAAHPVKKSELLRAGVKLLAGLSDAALLRALKNVPAIKTGRPKTKKGD